MIDPKMSKLREIKGCGKVDPEWGPHNLAYQEVDGCNPCLTLLVDAARAGAVEECAKVADECGLDFEGDCCGENIRLNILALLPPPSATRPQW